MPRHWELGSLDGLEALPGLVYVRARSPERSPGLMSRDDLARLLASEPRKTFSVAEYVPSIAGATYLHCGDWALIEVVVGHLSGLLGEGLLRWRYLLSPGGTFLKGQEFEQTRWKEATGEAGSEPKNMQQFEPRRAALSIHERVAKGSVSPRTLMEIMITVDRILWVDAKNYSWGVDVEALFSERRALVYGATELPIFEPVSWTVGALPAHTECVAYNLDHRALSSHFVTYSLAAGLGGLWNHGW